MKRKVSVSWSGGKDSAFALHKILLTGDYEVVSLHTVLNAETKRVGMHGIPETLIDKQAELLGIPLEKLFLDPSQNHDAYTSLVNRFYKKCSSQGIHSIVFGDIFLEDLKKFRDELLHKAGLNGIYPLWQIDSNLLIHDFVSLGFKTLICAANANYFASAAMGKTIDEDFIRSLPDGVDPCGENGEFHTFVYEGPIFREPVKVFVGETIERNYSFTILDNDGKAKQEKIPFWFCEISV